MNSGGCGDVRVSRGGCGDVRVYRSAVGVVRVMGEQGGGRVCRGGYVGLRACGFVSLWFAGGLLLTVSAPGPATVGYRVFVGFTALLQFVYWKLGPCRRCAVSPLSHLFVSENPF